MLPEYFRCPVVVRPTYHFRPLRYTIIDCVVFTPQCGWLTVRGERTELRTSLRSWTEEANIGSFGFYAAHK